MIILEAFLNTVVVLSGWYIGEKISYKLFGDTIGNLINEKFVKK